MEDKTVIRIFELAAGCFVIWMSITHGVDHFLWLVAGFLLGFPIDRILEQVRRERGK